MGNHTIVASSSAPNAGTDGNAANDTASATMFFSMPLSGAYTIGGTSADFTSFNDAVTTMAIAGVSGAVVFNVTSGTYNEQLVISEITGASATNTITFQSTVANQDSVILEFTSIGSSDYWTVQLDGADYFKFKNLTVKANNPSYGRVFDIRNGANYNIFEGNKIITASSTSSYNSCIYQYTGLSNNNTFLNNYMEGGYYSIYIRGAGSTSWEVGNIIQGNEIVGSGTYPMYIYYQDSIQIKNNYVHSGSSAYSYGIYCNYIFNEYSIIGNRVDIVATSNSTCYGIRDSYGNYASYNPSQSGNGLVANNMISIQGAAGTQYGLYSYYGNGTETYNNTVNITDGNTNSRCLYQYNSTSNSLGQTYKNNILINTGGGYAAYFNTPAAVTASDNNNFYATGTNLAYWSGAITDLTALQTASSMDTNSISAVASFVAANDLHNSSLATYQTGTSLTLITDDIDGDLRGTPPCMGADEYILFSTDAGITAMTEPIAACPGAVTVKALVQNYGIAAFTGVTVEWSVNGVTQTPYAYSGTIAAGASQEVTMGSYTFVGSTPYTLVFNTSNPNSITDQNPSNDTLTILGFQTSMSGTYTVGSGASNDYSSLTILANNLTSYGVCGPVVVSIDSGTYVGSMDLSNIVGASAINTITFKSAGNNNSSVNVQYAATGAADNYVVKLNNTPYVKFLDITFEATGSTHGYVFYMNGGADYTEIINCKIITTNINSTYFAGIYGGASFNNHCSFTYNEFIGGYYGMYWYGVSSASHGVDLTLEDNAFTDYNYYGVNIAYYDSLSIKNNSIMNGSTSGYVYGARIYYCNMYDIQNNNIQIGGSSYHYGLYTYYGNGDTTTSNIIANNVISLNGTGTSTWYGLYLYNQTYTNVYHNTIQIAGGSPTCYALYSSSGSNNNVNNNIFAHNGGGYAYYVSTPAAILSSDNNVYYSTGTNLAYWAGAKADLTALQTANSMDLASVEANPVFANVNAGDLTPLNIAVDNLGSPLGFLTDINGVTRSTTTPDAGAIEFTGLTADVALVGAEIENGTCLSTTDSVFVNISNVIGAAVSFTTDPLTIVWDVTGPVNSNASITINSGTLGMASDTIFGAAGVDLSIPGIYTLNCYIQSNSVNTFGGNDTIYSAYILDVMNPYYVSPKYATAGLNDTVELTVKSPYFPGGNFFISEICQYKTTTGAPTGGWPAYLLTDDYIEITGVPNSDLGGVTLEQWNSALASSYTFPAGTYLSSTGTAIIAVGQLGASAPSPSDNYYHGNGTFTGTWSSSTQSGRILKDGSGTIIDAVGYNGFTFPAAANVTAADWSATLSGGGGTCGIHITAADNNTGSCWSLSATVAQDPNTLNSGISAPVAGVLTGFSWSYNGVITSVNSIDTVVGPYVTTGYYDYIANYTSVCGAQSDTVFISAYIPAPLVVSNDTIICEGESVDLWAQMTGAAPWTFIVSDGVNVDTVDNVMSSPFTYTVSPMSTTTYYVLEYWDTMNVHIIANDTVNVEVAPYPVAVMSPDVSICSGDSTMLSAGSLAAPGLLFAMYIEGSSNNKGLSVFNSTTDTLNLDNYRIAQASNGNGWAYYHTFPVGAILAPNTSWVMVTDQVDPTMYDTTLADEVLGYPSLVHFNGDDARAIEVTADGGTTWTMVDIIGDPNNDPGSAWDVAGVTNATKDHSMIRKSTIIGGDINWANVAGIDSISSQYLVLPKNTFAGLGNHMVSAPPTHTYLWSTGETTASILVAPTTNTTYTVVLDNGNCQVTDSVVVTNLSPIVDLGADTSFKWTWESITLDAGNPNATWAWSTGGIAQTELLDSSNLILGANVVYVDVTENNCIATDTVIITVIDDVSINGSLDNVNVSIFPNPNNGQFTLSIVGAEGNMNMEIVNLAGQVVYVQSIEANSNFSTDIDVSEFSTGVYYIKLSNNKGVKINKLIIK